jgi:hypothetical protein
VINPRAGSESPTTDEAARERGVDLHVLGEGDDAAELARRADAETSAPQAATVRSRPSRRSPQSSTCRSWPSPTGRATTSSATSGSTATTRSPRWTPSRARSAGWTSAGQPRRWEEQSGGRFTLDSPTKRVQAAVDGEPVDLQTPLELAIEPGALRVLLPPSED